MNSKSDRVDYSRMEKIMLEQLRIRMQKIVGVHTLETMHASVREETAGETFAHHFVVEFEAFVMGQSRLQTYSVSVDVPKNWWQHLKQTVFPKSKIKYKQVYRKFELDHKALMPGWTTRVPTKVYMHTTFTEPGIHLK